MCVDALLEDVRVMSGAGPHADNGDDGDGEGKHADGDGARGGDGSAGGTDDGDDSDDDGLDGDDDVVMAVGMVGDDDDRHGNRAETRERGRSNNVMLPWGFSA